MSLLAYCNGGVRSRFYDFSDRCERVHGGVERRLSTRLGDSHIASLPSVGLTATLTFDPRTWSWTSTEHRSASDDTRAQSAPDTTEPLTAG